MAYQMLKRNQDCQKLARWRMQHNTLSNNYYPLHIEQALQQHNHSQAEFWQLQADVRAERQLHYRKYFYRSQQTGHRNGGKYCRKHYISLRRRLNKLVCHFEMLDDELAAEAVHPDGARGAIGWMLD
jgi:hypothetical protein